MEITGDLDTVPIVEVNSKNASEVVPALVLSIKTATFISLDLELSGLGNRKLLRTQNVEERYKHICDIANSRSVLAIGISCFKQQDDISEPNFLVKSYNVLTMCLNNFIVEPLSLKFLVEHKFDFNKQYSQGLTYHRANMENELSLKETIKQKISKKKLAPTVQYEDSLLTFILKAIVERKAPVIFHNALIDLVFFYSNFYAPPPSKLSQFMTDCSLLFAGGVFDTKVIAEFKANMQSSFLDYVFKRCQKEGSDKSSDNRISTVFLKYPSDALHYVNFLNLNLSDDLQTLANKSKPPCFNYAYHGWCENGENCPKSHSTELVLSYEDNDLCISEDDGLKNGSKITNNGDVSNNDNNNNNHSAGIDAFKTAYSFACFMNKYNRRQSSIEDEKENICEDKSKEDVESEENKNDCDAFWPEFSNQVYLSGKDFTLKVVASQFSKPSATNLKLLASIE